MKSRKIILRLIGGLATFLFLAVVALYALSTIRIGATFDVPVAAITTSVDSATIERGRHVAETRGCDGCHGADLSGEDIVNDVLFGHIAARNLTPGVNGAGSFYSDADWVRAIRSGVRPDGSALLIMPSNEYRTLGPEDLGALVSWLKTLSPVDTEPMENRVGPLARALLLAGQVPLLPAEDIDHADEEFSQPEEAPTVAFGEYLTAACVGCHGPLFAGGPIVGTPPDWPDAGNLTPDMETGIGSWSEEDFRSFFHDGIRPDGRQVDPSYMPWTLGAALTDVEEQAIWMFLRALPPREKGAKEEE